MATFVSEGKSTVVTAPKNLFKGEFVLLGALFGVASAWAQQGEEVSIYLSGIFEIEHPESSSWRVGDRLYWDAIECKFTLQRQNNPFVAVSLSNQGARGLVRIFGLAISEKDVSQ